MGSSADYFWTQALSPPSILNKEAHGSLEGVPNVLKVEGEGLKRKEGGKGKNSCPQSLSVCRTHTQDGWDR